MKSLCVAAAVFLTLSACSPEPGNTPKIAEGQRDALEKARGVEATVNQGAEQQREQVDEQSQ